MSDISVTGNIAYFNKDVYIYGRLYYDFEASGPLTFGDITVNGSSTFNGPATFNNDIIFNNTVVVPYLTVTELLTVTGSAVFSGISTFTNTIDATRLYVSEYFGVGTNNSTISASGITGNVGINSQLPEQKLDVGGSIKINLDIYDSLNSPGVLGMFLTKDSQGIKWTELQPKFSEGIFVYNDSTLVGVQSFRGLNLKTGRGTGITTDPIQGFVNPSNSTIADIYVYDYWEYVDGTTNIYRDSNVGIRNTSPSVALDVTGSTNISQVLTVDGATNLNSTLDVDGATTLNSSLDVDAATTLNSTLDVDGATTLNSSLDVDGTSVLHNTLDVSGATNITNTLKVTGIVTFNSTLNVDGATNLNSTLDVDGATNLNSILDVDGASRLNNTLKVSGISTFDSSVELNSALIDINNSSAIGKFDYRLASVGTGVSWRPAGVQTQKTIWVTLDGNDTNSGLLEGDAKRTIGAAATIAQEYDTIFVRPGIYMENNPIGLRTDVAVSGQDLRLVTVVPQNLGKDVFHVRRGCLIENLSFACSDISVSSSGGAVAFPPTTQDISLGKSYGALSGYTAPGPATAGSSGRWRSPYIRNCTNFMKGSIGMKIDGYHATAKTIGADLKCMVCDSFTQYNEAGIGVSITNNGYAQLVSIFTINCDIAIYADTGGSCDLTNSNSSFGNYGLVAVGLGSTEFTGKVYQDTLDQTDTVILKGVIDRDNLIRTPYDGQALWFKIPVNGTPITKPLQRLSGAIVTNGGSGYSASAPPNILVLDSLGNTVPLGPEGIIAEVTATIDDTLGKITSIEVVNSGRNYLPTQNIIIAIDGTATATAVMEPIYYSVSTASEPISIYPTVSYQRIRDSYNLIYNNKELIAEVAVGRTKNNPAFSGFTLPIIPNEDLCKRDIGLILDAVLYNLQFGGNNAVYNAGEVYITNPQYLSGEIPQSVYAYQQVKAMAIQCLNNGYGGDLINKSTYSTRTQYTDSTLIVDPSPVVGQYCNNVASIVGTLFDIVITAISSSTLPGSKTYGTDAITTLVFSEFIPYLIDADVEVEMSRISRILTSGHSFEYIGTGTDINTSTPFQGAVPIKDNEVVTRDGARIPFTSTDQKGNFDIGKGIRIDQTTNTITGRDFSRAIQAEVTPLILALR